LLVVLLLILVLSHFLKHVLLTSMVTVALLLATFLPLLVNGAHVVTVRSVHQATLLQCLTVTAV
jgi:hypothetical protein